MFVPQARARWRSSTRSAPQPPRSATSCSCRRSRWSASHAQIPSTRHGRATVPRARITSTKVGHGRHLLDVPSDSNVSIARRVARVARWRDSGRTVAGGECGRHRRQACQSTGSSSAPGIARSTHASPPRIFGAGALLDRTTAASPGSLHVPWSSAPCSEERRADNTWIRLRDRCWQAALRLATMAPLQRGYERMRR
jgi:hypothetical protein